METKLYIEKLYQAVGAQPHDPTWLINASELLGIDCKILQEPNWHLTHWESTWGLLEFSLYEERIILVWHRTDGSEPLADLTPDTDVPHHIQAVRAALMAKIVQTLPELRQLSYVRVGWPINWTKCTLTLDDKPIREVIKADALLGTCERYLKDNGKMVKSTDGESFVTVKNTGRVRIFVGDESNAIF